MGDKRTRRLATAFLLIPALVQFFPIFYLVCMSLKVGGEVMQYPPKLLPHAVNGANYREAMAAAPLGRFLLNSLVAATGITLLQLFTGVLAAYALARLEFRGKSFILGAILATMMIPGEVTIIPNYFTIGWF